MAIAGSLVATASARTDDFSRGMQRMRADLAQTSQAASTTQTSFAKLGGALTGLAAGALSIAALKSGLESIVRTGLDLERLRNSFTAITGSAEKSRQEFGFIRDTANRLGLDLQSLGDSYRQLIAATRGTQLEGQASRDLFTSLTNASRAYGLSTDQTGRALLALQQIISKGKVSQEELRGQLGEALPGASQIAARAFGVTTQELDKLIEKGLDGIVFARRFNEQLSRETPAAAQTAGNGIRRLGNEILLLKDDIANSGVISFLDKLASKGADLLKGRREGSVETQARIARESSRATGGTAIQNGDLDNISRQIVQAEDRLADAQRRNLDPSTIQFLRAELEAIRAIQQEVGKTVELRERENTQILERGKLLTEIGPQFEAEQRAQRQQAEKQAAEDILNATGRVDEFRIAQELATEKAEELEKETERGARQTVQDYRQIISAQSEYLKGLEEEIDSELLSADSIALKRLAQEPLTNAQREEALVLLQKLRIVRELKLAIEEETKAEEKRNEEASNQTKAFEDIKARVNRELLKEERDNLRDTQREIKQFGDFFTETILGATDIGKRGFRDFVDSVIRDFQRLLFRQYIQKPLSELILKGVTSLAAAFGSGGNYGGISQGFDTTALPYDYGLQGFANGGPVMGPGFFKVGEQGSEILALGQGQSGYVYPHGQSPGGVNVNVTIVAQDVPSFRRSQGEVSQRLASAVRLGLSAT